MIYLKKKLLHNAAIICIAALTLTSCFEGSNAAEITVRKESKSISELTVVEANKILDDVIVKAKQTKGKGTPALWTLKDDDTTIYIFGSFHFLPETAKWKTPQMNRAFKDASKVYFEADVVNPESMATVQALIMKEGLYSEGTTLSGQLDTKEQGIVDDAAKSVGVSLAQLNTLKPWLASIQLLQMNLASHSYSAEFGVETILTAEAKKTGMDVGFLETADLQIKVISGDSEEDQITALVFSSKTLVKGLEVIETLAQEWLDGDVTGIGALISNEDVFGPSTSYQNLLVNRNRNWVPQIEAMLGTPGTVFIAVGAGHLAGPDSVIKMLETKGYKIAGPH